MTQEATDSSKRVFKITAGNLKNPRFFRRRDLVGVESPAFNVGDPTPMA